MGDQYFYVSRLTQLISTAFPCKTIKDMVAYLKKKYPEKFGEKTDQTNRDKITSTISGRKRVCRDDPIASCSSYGLKYVLRDRRAKGKQKNIIETNSNKRQK